MKKFLFRTTAITLIVLSLIFAVSAKSPKSVTTYAEFTETAPDMTPDTVDESWGEKIISIDKNSQNAHLYTYKTGASPEDGLDIYARWDNEYLYLCFVSPDNNPAGVKEYYRGDGITLVMLPGDDVFYTEDVSAAAYTYTWSLDYDKKSITTFGAADNYDPTLVIKDGLMIAKIKVPLTGIGFKADEDKTDCQIAVKLIRLSSVPGDGGISGWLAWGKFYEDGYSVVQDVPFTKADGPNYIILANSSAEKTEEPADENTDPVDPVDPAEPTDPVQPSDTVIDPATWAEQPSDYAKNEVYAAYEAGLVPESLTHGFTEPVSRGAVAQMFVNLLEKASGKSAAELIAEKGAEINENAFTDTSDRAVLEANALGIINGTGEGKFSPDGGLKRVQIAAIINRVARTLGVETDGFTHSFSDITDNFAWADAELGWPVSAGIINGVGGGRFNPGGELKTQDAILIVYRAYKALTAE